ncbi:MAG: Rpn family recombination-promoting nuclease/putative transposase [Muribaculaceae bacterium]|nr:Rpn family recombination-promoting nuclease/putative transposase [Muribaculaceae bacterium]
MNTHDKDNGKSFYRETSEDADNRLIRFDWAIKRLLRHKADHTILNGFLSSLLGSEIRIQRLLESEGNQENEEDKYNRVDLLAENDKGEKILIEVQNDSEIDYFHRMAYGTSKLITEYIKRGEAYDKISRIYSINIVYFNLGVGEDVVYTGTTEFRGLHDHKVLELSQRMKRRYDISKVSEIFPQYYILKANDFNRWSKVPLEQWMYFLSNSEIPEDATAPGLQEAREELRISRLNKSERESYYIHLDNIRSARNVLETAHDDGLFEGMEKGIEIGKKEGLKEGHKEGLKEGKEKGRLEQIRKSISRMRENGFDDEMIAKLLDIDITDIDACN